MTSRASSLLLAALALAASTGCSKDKESGGGTYTPPSVAVVASSASVVANGTNTVTITVTDTQGGPVSVTTDRGTFQPGGTQTATVTGASGTLTLLTCNATATPSCAGTATVTATHASTATVQIAFGALATMCSADCTVDAGCPGQACALTGGGTGSCSATTVSTCTSAPACTKNPIGATTETSCSDGIDNDCNGATDCEEPSCADLACDTTSSTSFCKSSQCTDLASGLALEIAPARTRLPANGTAATAVVITLTSNGQPASGMSVTLTGNGVGAVSPATPLTIGADGTATFTYTASATPGVATLTAAVVGIATVTRTATITMPALGALQIPADALAVQGVIGSGWNESGWVSVVALDDAGLPYPDGLAVRFEHQRLGGSTLGAPTVACTVPSANCVAHVAATSSGGDPPDTVGIASARLFSGTVAGTLAVTASATIAGVTRTAALPTVAVVGAKASGANFGLVCGPRNVPALAETDCAISLVDAPFTCEVLLKDRFNNVLGTATQVIFMSETAAVGQVTTTPAYDPASPAPDLGIAVQTFGTMGAGLPFDVAPLPAEAFTDNIVVNGTWDPGEAFVDANANGVWDRAEASVSHALDLCGVRTHNPRDGVVTVLAVADGEEAFFDANGNGAYDAGEPFVDQGEPFVDQDDDGVRDADEWFLDVNGDALHTPGNLAWDGATKIWTQAVVVYTGTPKRLGNLGTRWADLGAFVDSCTPTAAATPFLLSQAGTASASYVVVASDMNLNMLSTASTYAVDVVVGTVTAEYSGFASYADLPGFRYRYWPCDQNGVCASQCRATGAATPCVMTPSVDGFGCGVAAGVRIVRGGAADPGTDAVDWVVSTPYDLYGSSIEWFTTARLTGTSGP